MAADSSFMNRESARCSPYGAPVLFSDPFAHSGSPTEALDEKTALQSCAPGLGIDHVRISMPVKERG